jgi:hypothetical protein
MPPSTQEVFPNIPTFPNTVPTAPLLRISLSKLLRHDEEEEQRFWNACCDLGFFYLDLRTGGELNGTASGNGRTNRDSGNGNGIADGSADAAIDGESLLNDAEALFKASEEFFDLPVEEKQKYDFADRGSYFGFVPMLPMPCFSPSLSPQG